MSEKALKLETSTVCQLLCDFLTDDALPEILTWLHCCVSRAIASDNSSLLILLLHGISEAQTDRVIGKPWCLNYLPCIPMMGNTYSIDMKEHRKVALSGLLSLEHLACTTQAIACLHTLIDDFDADPLQPWLDGWEESECNFGALIQLHNNTAAEAILDKIDVKALPDQKSFWDVAFSSGILADNVEWLKILHRRGLSMDRYLPLQRCSPIHYACIGSVRGLQCAKFLLDLNVDVKKVYDAPTSPIGEACFWSFEIVKHMVDNGVDVNMMDGRGRTALFYLVYNHKLSYGKEAIRYLVDHGANINFQTPAEKNTPLHPLIYRGDDSELACQMVRFCVELGADPSLCDAEGESLIALARRLKMQWTLCALCPGEAIWTEEDCNEAPDSKSPSLQYVSLVKKKRNFMADIVTKIERSQRCGFGKILITARDVEKTNADWKAACCRMGEITTEDITLEDLEGVRGELHYQASNPASKTPAKTVDKKIAENTAGFQAESTTFAPTLSLSSFPIWDQGDSNACVFSTCVRVMCNVWRYRAPHLKLPDHSFFVQAMMMDQMTLPDDATDEEKKEFLAEICGSPEALLQRYGRPAITGALEDLRSDPRLRDYHQLPDLNIVPIGGSSTSELKSKLKEMLKKHLHIVVNLDPTPVQQKIFLNFFKEHPTDTLPASQLPVQRVNLIDGKAVTEQAYDPGFEPGANASASASTATDSTRNEMLLGHTVTLDSARSTEDILYFKNSVGTDFADDGIFSLEFEALFRLVQCGGSSPFFAEETLPEGV